MTTPSPCSLALWGQQSFLCALLHVTCIIGRSDKRASLGGMSSKCEMEWVRGERGNHVRAERAGKKRVGRFERKRQRQSSRFARFIFDGIRRRRVECAKGAICKKAVGPSVPSARGRQARVRRRCDTRARQARGSCFHAISCIGRLHLLHRLPTK